MRKFSADKILKRNKTSLDSLHDLDVLAANIIENLQFAVESFNEPMAILKK